MSTHVIAYSGSINSASLTNLPFIQDSVLSPAGTTGLIVPGDFNALHAVAALGSDLTRAALKAPSLDVKRVNLEVYPHERGADIFTLTNPKLMRPIGDMVFDPGEVLTAQAAEDNAGADVETVVAWLKKPGALPAIPSGDVRMVRWAGTTTLVASSWTPVTLTLDQELPAGEYALVGIFANSATGIACRAIIPGQQNRPGVPVIAAASEAASRFSNAEFLKPFIGYEMGRFSNRQVPQLEFLALAADTAQTGLLFIVKVG